MCLVSVNLADDGALLPSNAELSSDVRQILLSARCRAEAKTQGSVNCGI